MFNKYIEQREGRGGGPQSTGGYLGGSEPPDLVVRWSAIVAALIFAGAMVLAYQAIRAESLTKEIVIRSAFNQIELRLQQLASARESYVACMTDDTCGVKIAFFEEAVRQMKVVEPVGFVFEPQSSSLKGTLKYAGDDLKTNAREIVIQLPKDITSAVRAVCPSETPLLAGVDGEGKLICRAIEKRQCEPGEYVTAIDPKTLAVTCAPVGKEIACPDGNFISAFEWQGEDRVVFTCRPRLNPFVAWKFQPALKTGPALSDVGGSQ